MSQVLNALVDARVDRRGVIIALGGGVVGDIAGFAASIYMRGIRYVQVPTTLLAQVDSSVGGKTGINHPGGKNLIGAFHQPSAVISDTDTLQTLPPRELSAGLAEVLKHGLVADPDYFERMAASIESMRAHDAPALADAIAGSCEIKASIVARDEREAGERALLNLGHTFGHAIEAMTGYSRWLHGEAVGCGLVLAAELSCLLGTLTASDVQVIESAVARAGLPTRVDGLSALSAIEAMRGDKKTEAGQMRFIVLDRIGRATQRTVPQATVVAGADRARICMSDMTLASFAAHAGRSRGRLHREADSGQPHVSFNAIAIASFIRRLFGGWNTRRRSSSIMKAICFERG